MKLLKQFLVRLSGNIFETLTPKLGPYRVKQKPPPLKLVSHNLHPEVSPDRTIQRTANLGHMSALESALQKGEEWLLSMQDPEKGFWVEELEADTTLTSDYVMLRRFLDVIDVDRERKATRYLLHTQLEDGGWPIFFGGPADISASVKAYFALKLAGVSPDEPVMQRARSLILGKGGVVQANVFTKITLALFGQYDWRGIPCMPPEIFLAPRWFYFNLYAVSYWSRAVIIPLLIIFAHRPLCTISKEQGIDELFLQPRQEVDYAHVPPLHRDSTLVSWRNFFVWVDGLLRLYEAYPIKALRKKALSSVQSWMIEHMGGEGGLGAIYPAMAYSIFALRALGYSTDHPLVQKALREIEALEIYSNPGNTPTPTMLHLQPCHSPVWDTALTINALIERGLALDHSSLQRADAWLRARQCRKVGDWAVSAPKARSGGWAFQFENEWYPDVDDTAAVVTGLAKINSAEVLGSDEALQRGFRWALALQGSDGGWGAYDKDNNKLIFNKIPFADHQALLDPSTADLTGRCLEMLGTLGYDQSHPAVNPAIEFLRKEQEPNGSWYGRWGVNYIYGTWCVLSGLRAIGMDMTAPWIQQAVIWLESVQNSDGGWGESCTSYAEVEKAGRGESAASQTAWALMALLQAGESDSISVVRGVNWLIRHQRENGVWDEPFHTGTGFPRVFYLRYHGYFKYFPIWALGMYRNVKITGEARADQLRKAAQVARRQSKLV
ncbi:MAG TPA: squalene--hopene cyclase [Nitrospirales bacterium]|nr:squalene--hopene cyclase [Nitrospirales bacterium]